MSSTNSKRRYFMRYIVDNDLHIHSKLSLCSGDHPGQTPENILAYGEKNDYKTICLTDHMWDPKVPKLSTGWASPWYETQSYEYTKRSLPLPKSDKVDFLFGAETDLDMKGDIGVSRETIDELDFVIISTTHMHMDGYVVRGDETTEERARLWVKHIDTLLAMDLPFHKIGLAHMTCGLINRGHLIETLSLIDESEYRRVFKKAAECGIGIELNFNPREFTGEDLEIQLKPYRIAKQEGCKFYFGSDAHTPDGFIGKKEDFELIVDLLGLEESDKFHVGK